MAAILKIYVYMYNEIVSLEGVRDLSLFFLQDTNLDPSHPSPYLLFERLQDL